MTSNSLHRSLQRVIKALQCFQSFLLSSGTVDILIFPIGDQFIFDLIEERRTGAVSTGQLVSVLRDVQIGDCLSKDLTCFVGLLQALIDLRQR